MKACVVQPYYSLEIKDADACFAEYLESLDACDESMDLIVLPEACDAPTAIKSKAEFDALVGKYNGLIRQKAVETAVRCKALVFVNCSDYASGGNRNTTLAIDETGAVIGKYFKMHPTPGEARSVADGGIHGRDASYCDRFAEPYVLEHKGIRYGFMTCYDFYFYEAFGALARRNVDIIIGASHQRSDTHLALETTGRFLSYNTNAYLVRAAVTLGEDSPVCGCSMVVAPNGELLLNMGSRRGLGVVEFDPRRKNSKPAGFGGAIKPHHDYIEDGRRPWLYRNGGSKVVRDDAAMPYPRLCAHRGFNTVAPENSMPAFGAAIALGANEIEFDLYESKDGVLVSIHDSSLDRVSDGTGFVWEYTLEELRRFDFGFKHGEHFRDLRIPTFEEILSRFAATAIMNIHVKHQENADVDSLARKLIAMLYKYDCEKHAYFLCDSEALSRRIHELDPKIRRVAGAGQKPWEIVERAIRLGCEKVQLYKPYFNQEMIDKAHAHGILCNVFWADEPEEAIRYLDMGINTILTNDYLAISNAVEKHLQKR